MDVALGGEDRLFVASGLRPVSSFDEACRQVIDYLAEVIPMGLWAATRVADGLQTAFAVAGDQPVIEAGATILFADSPCSVMCDGRGPQIACDVSDDPGYAACGLAAAMPLGAYIGIPIVFPDGRLFGTICGMNATPIDESARDHQPLLPLVSSLLSAMLHSEETTTAVWESFERARQEADVDELTGVLNRRGWIRAIAAAGARPEVDPPAAVLIIDLDRFKQVNDDQGHAAGDRHLRRTASALRSAVREDDVVARLGGDEFAVLLQDAGHVDNADAVIARAAAAVAAVGVAASIGYAPCTAGVTQAWRAADTAMYLDKNRRRTGALGVDRQQVALSDPAR